MQELFGKAVQALQRGDLEAASQHTAALRQAAPEHPEVLHLSGIVACELGQAEADSWLRRAAELAPANPEIPYNHGCALLKRGDMDAAIERFDACLKLRPEHASAWVNKGNALRDLGDLEDCRGCYEKALAANPGHATAMVNLGNLVLESDPQAALGWYEKALRSQHQLPSALRGRGQARLALGRLSEALQDLERAAQLLGADAATLSALGRAYTRALKFDQALAAYAKVTDLLPEDPDAWNDLATAATSAGNLDRAEASFRRALSLNPNHHLALENLAALLELANRPDEAMALIDEADTTDSPALEMVRARCLLREKRYDEARQILEKNPPKDDTRLAKDWHFTLAGVYDKSGDADAAMGHFAKGNATSLQLWQQEGGDQDQYVEGLAGIREMLGGMAWPSRPDHNHDAPAFVLGIQRSGTTLIDTILGVHPEVTIMEELPVLSRVISHMDRRFGRYPAAVPDLSEAALEELRGVYRNEATKLGGWSGEGLLVDKSPLHTVHLALIRRMFPGAPIVFVLRHPLDVVLSCFMQDFTMNSFMTNYTSLEGVARVYDAVMDLFARQSDHLQPPAHVIRYESLVEDPRTELGNLVAHLGLAWDDALMAHEDHARGRGLINTPSYEQVTQPIYKGARHRYKRYQEHLEPVMPVMQRWIEYFGYEG